MAAPLWAGPFRNGSFEEGLEGWSSEGNLLVISEFDIYRAVSGTNILVFNIGQQPPDGHISQVFDTVSNRVYRVDFDFGACSVVNQSEQRLEVEVRGDALRRVDRFSIRAPGDGSQYRHGSVVFAADSSETTLIFRDVSSTSFNVDLLLENVEVTELERGVLINGSFEEGYVGWTATGNQTLVQAPAHVTTDGETAILFNSLDVAGTMQDGKLVQSFSSIPGRRYALTFDAGVHGAPTDQYLRLRVEGDTMLVDEIFALSGPGTGTRYLTKRVSFVADSELTTVTFNDFGTTTYFVDLLLDHVRLEEEDPRLPVLLGHFGDLAAAEGEPAVMEVFAEGEEPLTYQWRRNGAPIDGATANSYILLSTQPEDAAVYDVIVSNPHGSVISSAGVLLVLQRDILVNGSFERGLAGWTHTGSVAASTRPLYEFSEGVQMVHFNSGQEAVSGVLSQTFPTEPGRTYGLRFDMGAFSLLNTREQRMEITVEGESTLLSEVRSVNAPGDGTEYIPQIFRFVADGPSATLTLRDVSAMTANVDLALDNVRVTLLDADVPSPEIYAVSRTSDGVIVHFSGVANHDYDLERSEDLDTWVPMSRSRPAISGLGTFEVSGETSSVAVYRVVVVGAEEEPGSSR